MHLPWSTAFLQQHSDEKVLLILRRHWLVLFRFICELIGLSLLPMSFFITWYWLDWDIEKNSLIYIITVLFFSLYYLGVWLRFYYDWFDYYLDVWVVTDQRIIDVQQKGIFNRVVSELNIVKIQDVTSEVKGELQTFLDYGNVYVQTAGEQRRFIFQQVPHPQAVAQLVIHTNNEAIKRHPAEAKLE